MSTPGRRDRVLAHLEADTALDVPQHLDRLASGRVVVVEIGDLGEPGLAGRLPFVHDELDGRPGLRPVGRGHREDVRVALAVRGPRAAESGRGAGSLVGGELGGERIGMRRAVEPVAHVPRLLGALIGFHAPRHVVAVIDLEVADRVAFSEHPHLVGEADVVVCAVADVVPHHLRRPGASHCIPSTNSRAFAAPAVTTVVRAAPARARKESLGCFMSSSSVCMEIESGSDRPEAFATITHYT